MSQSFGEDLKVVSPPLEPGSPAAVRQHGKALAGMARASQESGGRQIGQGAGVRTQQYAYMRSVVGVNLEEEVLAALLDAANGDEQLALDVFFAESRRAADLANGRGSGKRANKMAGAAAKGGSGRGNVFTGPRKPFDDLAVLLGNGVDADLLAPIAARCGGDIPKAVEAYFDNEEDHLSAAAARAHRAAEYAENYYKRPSGRGQPVLCNVYHLHWGTADEKAKEGGGGDKRGNSGLPAVGLGIYHSGIEVFGRELSFGWADGGLTGVFEIPAKCATGVMPKTTLKESVVLGHMFRSAFEVDSIAQRLAAKYRGDAYDLVRCNCNHFASELSQALVGKPIPAYVNRTAHVGRGILNVFSLPSQAIEGIVAGIKKVPKVVAKSTRRNKEVEPTPAQEHDSSATAAHGPVAGHGDARPGGGVGSSRWAQTSNVPVESPAGVSPIASTIRRRVWVGAGGPQQQQLANSREAFAHDSRPQGCLALEMEGGLGAGGHASDEEEFVS